jgi:AraC-like DNA-binding protein
MIVETRHARETRINQTYDAEVGRARGILRRIPVAGEITHSRRGPAADLSPWIAHYWMIHWDFRGVPPHLVENLPHPNVHVVFENGGAVVSGVQTRRFSRLLDDRSSVFGVKFRPGGFRPFCNSPASSLAGRTVAAGSIFGPEMEVLSDAVCAASHDEERMEAANVFFRERIPEPDSRVAQASQLVDRILQKPGIRTVDELVARSGLGKRTLQRIFNEYVGVSPKWVIRRYRLHELVEAIQAGDNPEWPQLAPDLGY